MVRIFETLAQLKSAVIEQRRRGAEKELEGAVEKQRADTYLELLDQITAEAEQLVGEPHVVDVSPESSEVEPAPKEAWSVRRARLEALFGCDWGELIYITPENDESTGAPIYDPRVVADKRTNRLRAFAAARVYGQTLKTASLAEAIYLTGETRAASAASVKSSLAGLTRYGHDWRRKDGGWLEYAGEGLSPNRDMIVLLARERQEQRQESET